MPVAAGIVVEQRHRDIGAARVSEHDLDDLGATFLGQIMAAGSVAYRAGDIKRACGGADRRVAVQLDVAGPGVIAGDVEQGAYIVHARPVQDQRLSNWHGNVTYLQLSIGADGGVGAAAQGPGVGDFDDAAVVVEFDIACKAAVVGGQDQRAA